MGAGRSGRRRVGGCAAALALLVVLSACSSSEPQPGEEPEQVARVTRGGAAVVTSNGYVMMDAGLMGHLQLNDRGCFTLSSDGVVLVVSDSWAITPAGDGLVTDADRTIHLGEPLNTRGGTVDVARNTQLGRVAARCAPGRRAGPVTVQWAGLDDE